VKADGEAGGEEGNWEEEEEEEEEKESIAITGVGVLVSPCSILLARRL